MMPEQSPQVETHVAVFADILLPMDGSEPPVIVGGHAVNLWRNRSLPDDAPLAAFPETSHPRHPSNHEFLQTV